MSSPSVARHPVGLYLLCVVELCERFAGSLLGSLMLLYLNERLGMAAGSAARWTGAFNGAVYGASVLGGFLADRILGTRRAILLGAALLALGYAVLSMDQRGSFYAAAGLLVFGHALFKPNIVAAVGKLYGRGDHRRDEGYSVFYVVLNIGAAIGPLAGGWLATAYGWSIAFGVAALAMLLVLVLGCTSYSRLTATEQGSERDVMEPPSPRVSQTQMIVAAGAVLVALLLFTATYEQAGQSLLFWARDCTRRTLLGHTVPPSYLLAVPAIGVLTVQPVLARLLAALAKRGREPSQRARMQAGMLCSVAAYGLMVEAARRHAQHRAAVSVGWVGGCLAALTLAELLVYPVSMALITRLAPPSLTALATGFWMAAVAIGAWLAGLLAARWAVWPHVALFSALVALALLAAAVLAATRARIHRALNYSLHTCADKFSAL